MDSQRPASKAHQTTDTANARAIPGQEDAPSVPERLSVSTQEWFELRQQKTLRDIEHTLAERWRKRFWGVILLGSIGAYVGIQFIARSVAFEALEADRKSLKDAEVDTRAAAKAADEAAFQARSRLSELEFALESFASKMNIVGAELNMLEGKISDLSRKTDEFMADINNEMALVKQSTRQTDKRVAWFASGLVHVINSGSDDQLWMELRKRLFSKGFNVQEDTSISPALTGTQVVYDCYGYLPSPSEYDRLREALLASAEKIAQILEQCYRDLGRTIPEIRVREVTTNECNEGIFPPGISIILE